MDNSEIEVFKKYFLQGISEEFKTTKRVISAVNSKEKSSYRPDPKAKTGLELAWHIATSDLWFLNGIINGEFGSENKNIPEDIKSGEDIVAWFDPQFSVGLEKVRKMSTEDCSKPIDFFGLMQLPAIMYLDLLIRHSVHHRGQLSTYLRPMGSKVPSIYGGSADEPFQM